MSKLPFATFAQKLASNPRLIAEEEEATLRELLALHSQGMLDPELVEDVEQVIQTIPLAVSIWREFQASEEQLKTGAGQAWLESAGRGILKNVLAARAGNALEKTANMPVVQAPLSALLASLQDLISELFVSRASLARASGREGMKRTTKDGETRILLESDSAGRQWLYVTSKNREFAGRSFQVEVEPTQVQLSFSEATPGVYEAHVRVSAELAAAFASGAELKLIPVPLS